MVDNHLLGRVDISARALTRGVIILGALSSGAVASAPKRTQGDGGSVSVFKRYSALSENEVMTRPRLAPRCS